MSSKIIQAWPNIQALTVSIVVVATAIALPALIMYASV